MRPSLTLNENGFVGKLYLFSRNRWEDFTESHDWRYPVSDLCTVVRTITILMPLAIIINLISVIFCGYAVWFLLQVIWATAVSYITLTVVTVILSVLGFITSLALGILIMKKLSKEIKTVTKKTETFKVAVAYIKARKERICPTMEFKS